MDKGRIMYRHRLWLIVIHALGLYPKGLSTTGNIERRPVAANTLGMRKRTNLHDEAEM